MTRQRITFETVRRGWHLVDEYGQICRVESVSRKYQQVVTRRQEERDAIGRRLRKRRMYWDTTATWTPQQFNARCWVKAKVSEERPASQPDTNCCDECRFMFFDDDGDAIDSRTGKPWEG